MYVQRIIKQIESMLNNAFNVSNSTAKNHLLTATALSHNSKRYSSVLITEQSTGKLAQNASNHPKNILTYLDSVSTSSTSISLKTIRAVVPSMHV